MCLRLPRGLGSGKHSSALRLSYPLHQAKISIGDGVPLQPRHSLDDLNLVEVD